MKLAIVISKFPCTDEAFILRELKALDRKGIDMRIFSLRNAAREDVHADARALGARTRYSPFFLSAAVWRRNLQLLLKEPSLYLRLLFTILRQGWKRFPFLWRSLAVFPMAVRWGMELRQDRVQRIHAHWATHPSTAAFVMSRICGTPFSITAHAHDIYLDQTMLPYKLQEASAVLTCTRQNLAFLEKLVPGLPAGRVQLSYHGVDLGAYRPGEAPGRFRVLGVGTLLPRKGFDTLIEACAVLQKRGVEFECILVGDGPTRGELEALAARLGLSAVRFLGKRSQEELPEIYRSASVLVMPANFQAQPGKVSPKRAADLVHFGIPNVILEAMASGLPVVSTRLPAVSEVLEDGRTGFFVDERDPEGLADALMRLERDPSLRERMGQEALQRVRSAFDLEATSTQVAAALGF